MPNQVNSRYLVCSKNRGFQRKHIDVCKRCSGNDECREYQEYLRMEPAGMEPNNPIQTPDPMSMVAIVEQLAEILQLLDGDAAGYRLNRQIDATYRPDASLNQFLRAELKAIKSICQFIPAKPDSQHRASKTNTISH